MHTRCADGIYHTKATKVGIVKSVATANAG
jgi:hypothetical protein